MPEVIIRLSFKHVQFVSIKSLYTSYPVLLQCHGFESKIGVRSREADISISGLLIDIRKDDDPDAQWGFFNSFSEPRQGRPDLVNNTEPCYLPSNRRFSEPPTRRGAGGWI